MCSGSAWLFIVVVVCSTSALLPDGLLPSGLLPSGLLFSSLILSFLLVDLHFAFQFLVTIHNKIDRSYSELGELRAMITKKIKKKVSTLDVTVFFLT